MEPLMTHLRTLALPLLGLLTLSACDQGFGGELDPVIGTTVGPDIHAVATRADRRLVITAQMKPTPAGNDRAVCAEPSPDAIASLAASVNASLSGTRADDSFAAQRAAALATATSGLVKRSQGLQFYRDGIFALCQGAMNGLRREEDIAYLRTAYATLQQDAKDLILAEIQSQGWHTQTIPVIAAPVLKGQTAPASK